jgi:phospholipid/cholesterol/gamma-HCH transport system ATP-binding protein
MQNKIEIRGLCKRFGEKIILDNLDLDIEDKKSLVVLGRSGMGKSVLIKNISTLIQADSGSIKIDGFEVTTLSGKKRLQFMNKFGFLFQGSALFDSMTVWENVAFKLLNNLKFSKKDAYTVALEKMKMVDLDERVSHLMPSELSGGMQKRVALARTLACNPSIIFFDEPTTGLDPITSQTINELIIRTKQIVGATTITITHDIKSAMQIADRIVLLDEGKIKWDGLPNDVLGSDNYVIKQFFNNYVQ